MHIHPYELFVKYISKFKRMGPTHKLARSSHLKSRLVHGDSYLVTHFLPISATHAHSQSVNILHTLPYLGTWRLRAVVHKR